MIASRRSTLPLAPFARPAMFIALCATFGSAYAQSATGTNPPDRIEKVTVTGSNLPRTDQETPSPVQVLTAQDIKASGFTDISDVLQHVSAAGAGTLSQGFGGAFAAGASGVALRGLSVGATLVLIDGHRMAPYALSDDGQRQFVDISQIPLEAIERIEILKDGASSIYGSDAIAGVVNVILRKSYTGEAASVDFGTSKYWDAHMQHVAGTVGFGDLNADGHNMYLSVEYRKQSPVYLGNRPQLARTDYTSVGGNNLTPGASNGLNGGFPASATGYFQDPNTGAITGFLPGCDANSFAANKCTFSIRDQYIQPPTQNVNLLASFTQNLAAGWQFNVKGSIFNERSNQTLGYPGTAGTSGYLGVALGPGQPASLVPSSGQPVLALVPASYPGNTTGSPQILNARITNVVPNTAVDSTTYRLVGELSGAVAGWDTNISAGVSESIVKQHLTGSIDIAALETALQDPVHPFQFGANFNQNTAAENASVFPEMNAKATNKLEFVTAEASRGVYDLRGGPLTVGVGVDFRHQDLNATAPALVAEGIVGGNNAYAVGTQNVGAIYAELSAPVLNTLELDASVRHDKYAGSFSSTTPKVGFKFTPVQQFALRGTYSEGFRAPNPAEVGNVGQSFLANTIADPVLCANPGGTTGTGNFTNQCATQVVYVQGPGTGLQPEKSKSYTLGFILEPIKNYSLSVDYYDIKIKNQIISAFEDPDYDPLANAVRGQPVLQPQVQADGTTANVLTPVGPIAYLPVPYVNAAYTKTNGVDLDARAKFSLGAYGRLTLDLTETHLFQYRQKYGSGAEVELAGTHGPSGVSGDTGNPKDRAQFIVTWEHGPLTLTGTTNWTGPYSVIDPSAGLDDCQTALNYASNGYFAGQTAPSQYCRVHAFASFDLYGNYQLTKQWSVHASVLNMFNAHAPLDFQTYGGGTNGSGTPYSPVFAQEGAIGRFYSVGAQYRFN